MPIHPSRATGAFLTTVATTVLATVLSGGCTFLATFDDPPSRDSAGHCPGFTRDPAAAPCSPFSGHGGGVYCGCDTLLPNYQGSPNDLVTCGDDGTIVQTTSCAEGCVIYPAPLLTGTCDPCPGRADGTWCARDVGVDSGKIMLTCRAGRVAPGSIVECPTACGGAGPAAACQ